MKWFDLSRFGAKLTVLPKSRARSRTVLRLEMAHGRDWQAERERFQAANPGNGWVPSPASFREALADLGFSPFESQRLASPDQATFDQHGDEYVSFVSEAVRDTIKLSDLQRLMPGLSQADVVDMPLAQVVTQFEDVQGYEEQWEALRSAMVHDAIDVWAPRYNPWTNDPETAKLPLVDALRHVGIDVNNRTDRTIGNDLTFKAAQLGYRGDALEVYYVSQEAAEADGLTDADYQRVGFAASIPLQVQGGKVVALRSVWDMPDLRRSMSVREALRIEPEQARGLGSISSDYLRQRETVRGDLRGAFADLRRWGENPKLLDGHSPDRVWGAVSRFAEAAHLAHKYPWMTPSASELLQVAPLGPDGRTPRLKPMGALDDADIAILARAAEREGIDTQEAATALLNGAKRLHGAMVSADLAAERAKVLAEKVAALAAEAPIVEAAAGDGRKHVDAGVKIGGARKDYAAHSLTWDEVAGLNRVELSLHVSKQNVWPPLDYAAMRETGMSATVAMSIKLIKDAINTSPYLGFRVSAEAMSEEKLRGAAERYVVAVAKVRELLEDVTTEADLTEACLKIRDFAGEGDRRLIYGGATWEQLGETLSKLIAYEAPIRQASRKISKSTAYWGKDEEGRSVLAHKDPWTALIKEKVGVGADAQAERKRKAELDRELHMPHLQHVKRVGTDWRNGRDVTADDLIEQFGFRAVEYGEWLPQKERQEVVNMAYDCFADLADALNLDPKDVSLGGELAVAFGARGRGGKGSALAHFEPARNVINLTRMSGAGSVAHEWWHAFDHKAAKDDRLGVFATESKHLLRGRPLHPLTERLQARTQTPAEIVKAAAVGAAQSRASAETWMPQGDAMVRANALIYLNERLDKEQEKIRAEVEAQVRNREGRPPILGECGVLSSTTPYDVAEISSEIRDHWKDQMDKKDQKGIYGNLWHWAKRVCLLESVEAYQRAGVELTNEALKHAGMVPTDFMKDAEKFDKMRSKAYWATPIELFARAGAAYVHDKLEGQGVRSDYLVAGAQENRCLETLGASPNPRGEDRTALYACFEAVMDEYRLKCRAEREASQESTLSM